MRNGVRLTRLGYGDRHSHTRRAEVSLARFQAGQGDANARRQLLAYAQPGDGDIEIRKAAWLARAYAAELDCARQPGEAAEALESVLAQMRQALPEGGAIPREVAKILAACGGSR